METKEKLTYHSYLKLEKLLKLQQEISDPAHQDELLFIIIHQSHELWFKLVLHEMGRLQRALDNDSIFEACKVLQRMREIFKSLIQQIDILHTLSPDEFLGYRDLLAPASGFQSYQFKLIEFSFGLKDPHYIERYKRNPEIYSLLDQHLTAQSIWDKVLLLLKRKQVPIPPEVFSRNLKEPYTPNSRIAELIKDLYLKREQNQDLHFLFEALIEMDAALQIWRLRHLKNAEKTIGFKTGTGGSSGIEYLHTNVSKKIFPELWDVRTIL